MAEVVSPVHLIRSFLEIFKPYMEMRIERGGDWLELGSFDCLIWRGSVVYIKRDSVLQLISDSLVSVGCGTGSSSCVQVCVEQTYFQLVYRVVVIIFRY